MGLAVVAMRLFHFGLPLTVRGLGFFPWLILGFEDTVPPELKNRIRKAEMMMDDPKKHVKSMRVR